MIRFGFEIRASVFKHVIVTANQLILSTTFLDTCCKTTNFYAEPASVLHMCSDITRDALLFNLFIAHVGLPDNRVAFSFHGFKYTVESLWKIFFFVVLLPVRKRSNLFNVP